MIILVAWLFWAVLNCQCDLKVLAATFIEDLAGLPL